jgi:MFS family permease
VPLLQQVRAGIAFTFSLPWLWITIAIFAFVNLGIAGPTIVALPLLVRDVLHADARVYGAIGAAVGAGQICGTFLSGQFLVRKTGLVMYIWAILAGVAVAAYGLVAALPDIFFFASRRASHSSASGSSGTRCSSATYHGRCSGGSRAWTASARSCSFQLDPDLRGGR